MYNIQIKIIQIDQWIKWRTVCMKICYLWNKDGCHGFVQSCSIHVDCGANGQHKPKRRRPIRNEKGNREPIRDEQRNSEPIRGEKRNREPIRDKILIIKMAASARGQKIWILVTTLPLWQCKKQRKKWRNGRVNNIIKVRY